MKKIIAISVACIIALSLAACGATQATTDNAVAVEENTETVAAEEKAEAVVEEAEGTTEQTGEGFILEEDAEAAREADTLESNPLTGYEYNESTGNWYFSNYPNYKDFKEDGVVKVAFVCKFSGPWFTPKQESLGQTVEAAGYEYHFIDANSDEQAWLDGVLNVVNQDFDAIVLTPVNTALLPDALETIHEAGIAYLTTDDPGPDAYGFYSPHYGLDDYYLYNELGKVAANVMEKKNFLGDVADDYSDFLFVIMDSPAVEAIHNRSLGYYDAIKEKYPDIPEEQILWLDCGAGLGDDIVNKFGPTVEAYKATTKKWLLTSGTGSAVVPCLTLLNENGINMEDVILSETCATEDVKQACELDTTDSLQLLGLASAPSGVGMGNIIIDLVENGTPIPAFSPYDFILVNHDTIGEFWSTYYE